MRFRWLQWVPLASVAIYACSGSDDPAAGPPSGYADVALEGKVTDETLVAFVQALEQRGEADVPSRAPVVAEPASGAVLARGEPATFRWSFGATAVREAPATDRWAGLDVARPSAAAGFLGGLGDLLGGPRRALAHGDPYSGTATFVVFSDEAGTKLLRVLTSQQEFTPSQEAWDEMAAVGVPITLELVSAIFEQNRVGPDDGPVAGAAMQFTISP
ncbi:hypothetical protein WMF11_25025 [Sorangium sp. So ce295]|uniref:hypothetical protein n=1 Tax=Sorangium sp. So ce295 TaxID=3133295 RepID=UPI003F5F9984